MITGLGGLMLASSAPARAGEARVLGEGFDNPTTWPVTVPAVDTTPKAIGASKKGKCHRHTDALQTSSTPTLVFRVEKETRLSFQLDALAEPGETRPRSWACFNLWFPDRTILSASPKKGTLTTDTFPPGEYKLHVAFNKSTPKKYWAKRFSITFIDPNRPSADTPSFVVTSDFSNPTIVPVTVAPATTQASALGMTLTGCRGLTTLFPSLTLDVKAKTQASLQIAGKKFMVKTPDGRWFCKEYGNELTTTWPPGRYQVWVHAKAGRFTGMLWDEGRAPEYEAKATQPAVGPLPEAVWLSGEVQPASARPFGSSCYARFARHPDRIVTTARPLADLSFELVDPSGRLQLNVEGPLEGAKLRLKKTCNRKVTKKVGSGAYALFVGAKGEVPAGAKYLILVRDGKTAFDALTLLPSYPKNEALPLEQRSFRTWYPFIPKRGLRVDTNEGVALNAQLFVEAPKSMFVFPTYDLDDVAVSESDRKLGIELPKKGEPLLLVRPAKRKGTDARHTVRTADGEIFSVLASALSGTAPGPAKWPKGVRRAREVEDHYELHKISTSKDKKAIDRFYKMSRRADDCWNRFWQKHHGGTSAQLYTVSDKNGKVAGVTDYSAKIRKRADRKCKVSKVAAYHQRLTKKLNRAFHKRRGKALAEVRSRFDG